MHKYLALGMFIWGGLFITSSAEATNYYVNAAGLDSNPGTISQPWKTVAPVNSTNFTAGDQIFFAGGQTFGGELYFDSSDTGSSSSPITISSYGTGRATISATTTSGFLAYDTAGLKIDTINFVGSGGTATGTSDGIIFYNDLPGSSKLDTVIISNVDISNFNRNGISVGASTTGYTNLTITNVSSHDNNSNGLLVWGPQLTGTNFSHSNVYVGYSSFYNNLGNNVAKGNGAGSGAVIGSTNGGTIERSIAYNNGSGNVLPNGPVGIWAYDSNNITIQYNESHHNHTGSAVDGDGFDLDGGVTNSVMQYNYSHDNDGAGYLVLEYTSTPQVPANDHNVVRYNISENDGRKHSYAGIFVGSNPGINYLKNLDVYNNTVYTAMSTSGTPTPFSISSATTNVHARNNIFVSNGSNPLINVVAGQTGILLQGNDYWPLTGSSSFKWGTSTYTSLSSFRTATGQETNGASSTGFSLDPKLTSPGNGGTIGDPSNLVSLSAYKLSATSSLINAGLDLSFLFGINPGSTDYYGSSIPQFSNYDVGAHEATSTATTFTLTGPSSGNANATSTNFTVSPNGAFTGLITITPTGTGSAGLSATVLTFNATSTAQTFTITPTVAGSITLTPTNNVGLTNPGNLSYTVNAVAPAPPQSLTGTATSTQVSLSWSAPSYNGGSALTQYIVQDKLTASSTFTTVATTSSTTLTSIISGLTNGSSYDFQVLAQNIAGTSSPSNIFSATPSLPISSSPTQQATGSWTAGSSYSITVSSAPSPQTS